MPRHIAAITRVGEVLGFRPDTFTDVELESVDRAFDEVFQSGYEAGTEDMDLISTGGAPIHIGPDGFARVDL